MKNFDVMLGYGDTGENFMSISYDAISSALQTADIERLFGLGAPRYKYNQEAQSIADALQQMPLSQIAEQSVAAVIMIVWAKSFALSSENIAKRKIAFLYVARRLI